METLYKPDGVEQRWQRIWEEEGLYASPCCIAHGQRRGSFDRLGDDANAENRLLGLVQQFQVPLGIFRKLAGNA